MVTCNISYYRKTATEAKHSTLPLCIIVWKPSLPQSGHLAKKPKKDTHTPPPFSHPLSFCSFILISLEPLSPEHLSSQGSEERRKLTHVN